MKIDLTFIPKAVSEKNSQLLSNLQVKVHKVAKCCFQALEKLFLWIRSAFSKFPRTSIAPQKIQARPAQTQQVVSNTAPQENQARLVQTQQASNNATSQEPLSAWKFPVTEEECASLPVVPSEFTQESFASASNAAPQESQARPAQTQQASSNVASQEPLSAWKFPVTEEECASLPVVPFVFGDGTILVPPSDFHLVLTHSALLQAIVQSDNASGPLHFNKSSVNLSEFTRESFASALDILRDKHIFKQDIESGGVALLEHLLFEGTALFALDPSLLLEEFEDEIKDSWRTTLPVSVFLTRQIISDLPNLACFLNIKEVILSGCALPNGCAFLASLTHLEILNLRFTNVADISFLQQLPKLKTLNLTYCKQIQDFAVIETLSHLEELNLKLTNVADISFLQHLTELKTLNLSYCRQIQDFALIGTLSHLEELNLGSTKIADLSFLQHLTELKTLDLESCNQIQDFSMIGTLSHLQLLTLSSSNVADVSFLQRLPKLRIVRT